MSKARKNLFGAEKSSKSDVEEALRGGGGGEEIKKVDEEEEEGGKERATGKANEEEKGKECRDEDGTGVEGEGEEQR